VGDSFRDLIVWQWAVQLSISIYRLASSLPISEQFGLTNQLRRASISISSNIAESYGKSAKGEYVSFPGHTRGSNSAAQTRLVIAEALGFGQADSLHQAQFLSNEVGRMLVTKMKELRHYRRAFLFAVP
jgi:four helix bundle protein